ncbi:calmodulin [Fonticula alba]|uniref:Calmodulin n=1 Tax=Fonticula alba TaxID=691883 RepID=A0A058Z5Y9_FONAL|nr:calmodulin [Fonticula alba]KCV69709.1 calmodulin [Fonticula alba]|eukprot:XP_009496274.1 calmodulin [Fonticula alba]
MNWIHRILFTASAYPGSIFQRLRYFSLPPPPPPSPFLISTMAVTDEESREAFNLYDKLGDGTISVKDLPDLLRAVGQNPLQREVDEICKKIDPSGNKRLTFDEYKAIQNRADGWKAHGSEEEFIQGFAVFDRDGNGLISAGELRYVLTSLGEKLSDREVDELLRGVELNKDGSLNYEEFVRTIIKA